MRQTCRKSLSIQNHLLLGKFSSKLRRCKVFSDCAVWDSGPDWHVFHTLVHAWTDNKLWNLMMHWETFSFTENYFITIFNKPKTNHWCFNNLCQVLWPISDSWPCWIVRNCLYSLVILYVNCKKKSMTLRILSLFIVASVN